MNKYVYKLKEQIEKSIDLLEEKEIYLTFNITEDGNYFIYGDRTSFDPLDELDHIKNIEDIKNSEIDIIVGEVDSEGYLLENQRIKGVKVEDIYDEAYKTLNHKTYMFGEGKVIFDKGDENYEPLLYITDNGSAVLDKEGFELLAEHIKGKDKSISLKSLKQKEKSKSKGIEI